MAQVGRAVLIGQSKCRLLACARETINSEPLALSYFKPLNMRPMRDLRPGVGEDSRVSLACSIDNVLAYESWLAKHMDV